MSTRWLNLHVCYSNWVCPKTRTKICLGLYNLLRYKDEIARKSHITFTGFLRIQISWVHYFGTCFYKCSSLKTPLISNIFITTQSYSENGYLFLVKLNQHSLFVEMQWLIVMLRWVECHSQPQLLLLLVPISVPPLHYSCFPCRVKLDASVRRMKILKCDWKEFVTVLSEKKSMSIAQYTSKLLTLCGRLIFSEITVVMRWRRR